jgi:putative ABC transport system permease protein
MNIETWKVALDSLRANKLKAFLTMLGVVIGSACIVLVVTVALTGKRLIIGQIEAVGSNIVYTEVVRAGTAQLMTLADEISLADMDAVRLIPRVLDVGGTRQFPMTVVVEGIERPVNMVGITEGFQRIRRLVILRGRALDADDMATRAKVCLLTEELARVVFPYEDPVGRAVRVGELTFTVVGVFRERVSTFGQSEIQRESVVIPFPLMKLYAGEEYVRVLYAQAATPQDVPAVTREVEDVLKSRHRPGAVYLVQNLTALLDAARKISLVLTIVLLLVAFIALTISGIGIMNIMLVTVTQRTREIGIRKAIGAPNREILEQFLLESFIISGTGAVAGILIAVSLPVLVQGLLRAVPSVLNVDIGVDPASVHIPISWLSVVVAFLVTCLTGILFGYLPANKAAKLQPTESLRYE